MHVVRNCTEARSHLKNAFFCCSYVTFANVTNVFNNNNSLFGKIRIQMNSSVNIKVICLKINTDMCIYTFNYVQCSIKSR